MPDSCAAFGCTNRRSNTSLQFYRMPSGKRYPERRIKWVTTMRREKWPVEKINNARICSAHFVTGKPFQEHEFFLQFLLSANKICV